MCGLHHSITRGHDPETEGRCRTHGSLAKLNTYIPPIALGVLSVLSLAFFTETSSRQPLEARMRTRGQRATLREPIATIAYRPERLHRNSPRTSRMRRTACELSVRITSLTLNDRVHDVKFAQSVGFHFNAKNFARIIIAAHDVHARMHDLQSM